MHPLFRQQRTRRAQVSTRTEGKAKLVLYTVLDQYYGGPLLPRITILTQNRRNWAQYTGTAELVANSTQSDESLTFYS